VATGGSGPSEGGTGSSGSGSTPSGGAGGTGSSAEPISTPENLLVAFFGDQGNTETATRVLELVKKEKAAAVVHMGDYDYANDPNAWETHLDSVLGKNFPYFAIVGNHDAPAWKGYAERLAARAARVPEMKCTGELGVRATCTFRGLYLVETCIGVGELGAGCAADNADHVKFVKDSLASNDAIWSACTWHKNQRDMQVGTKLDEVGWKAYQECMKGGAFIATGHEHSYGRTRTLTKVGDRVAGHGATGLYNLLEVGPGKTFVFVSGLGGASVRPFDHVLHDTDTWWASYYASDAWRKNGDNQDLEGVPGAPGVLFIRFHVDGNPRKAEAYFKDITGRVVDSFTMFSVAE
jgi:hypothetical protein